MNAFQRLKEHPKGFKFIFWGELAERASFYGMRTLLALYMITILGFREDNASFIMTWFIAACYIAPLFGGVIADRFLGRYKTILYFSGPYILGHIILGTWESPTALFTAMVLLAFGSGSIKPNTSTLMGAMYEEQKKEALLTEAFSYFYAAINIGSAVSTLGLPWLRDHIAAAGVASGMSHDAALSRGYAVALMVPAALMALAFVFFAIGKKHYPVEQLKNLPPKTAEQKRNERATLGRIAGLFSLIVVFWLIYDQSASTWIYFAKSHMDLTLWGTTSISPDQVQGLNPVFIVMLTPVFNAFWEAWKNRRGGVEVPDTRKMFIGFVILTVCMAMISAAAYLANDGKVSVWWLNIATFIITMSELCISVVGLEFAFKVAAPGTKSFVTGCFLFTVFAGDFLGGIMDKLLWSKVSAGNFFAVQAVAALLTTVAFVSIARKFEREHSAHVATTSAELSSST